MKQPKVRFRGYEGEWESCALKDICEINPKSTLPNVFEYVDLEAVVGTEMLNHRREYRESAPSRAQRLAQKGDIFYQTVRPYQKNNYLFDKEDTNFVFSTGYAQLRTRIDSAYLFTLMQSSSFVNKVLLDCTGTNYPAINPTNLSNINIQIVDKIKEQTQIASFFTHLDTLLSATTKKIATLKQVKAASLQDMFPKEGETIPKIRCKGFEGEWEKVYIKSICNITTGKSNTQDQVKDGFYPFFIRSEKVMKSNKYLYDCEAVITIGDGNIGRVFHYANGKFDLHQRCYMMFDFKNIDAKYFYYYFSSFFYDRAIKMSAKATVDSVRLDMISDMQIQKPTNIKEQQQIAAYFTTLDRLITLEQERLEKLRQVKSACLDTMFV